VTHKKAAENDCSQLRQTRSGRQLAYVQLASSELTRDINRDVVLERIRELQPLSRVEIAGASGLQPSTVSSIVEQLLEEGWIKEGAVLKTARGRRPTMLSLNDDMAMLVADVRPTRAAVAVIDLNGRFLAHEIVPLPGEAKRDVQAIAIVMERLRMRYPNMAFEGVGLSLPGRVDPDTNRLVLAPNLRWCGYDVAGELSRRLALQVELENDANACLLAELWFGHVDGVQNAVLIAISEGVGASVLSGGRILQGRRGLAGEFGHMCIDSTGPKCGCGQVGCWEMFASSTALLRYYAERNPAQEALTVQSLLGLALSGNKDALHAIERQGIAIGRGLRTVNAALSPDIILFAGDITLFWSICGEQIKRECNAGLLTSSAPRIISIGDGELALLRGAAAVVLQRHSGYYKTPHTKIPGSQRASLTSKRRATKRVS
jgi:predicted NBD/HSP70 family sugar kinase